MGTEPPSRESSKQMVALAQRVLREKPVDKFTDITRHDYNQLLKDAQSLAGSVLSQADPHD